MHPANENGYTPHGMSEHMGMMPQDLNSHAYQQPLPHVIPPSSGISVATYHQSDVHHRIMHPSHPPPPPQPAPRCTSHQQPAAQPPRSESYGGDSHFKKTEHPTEFSNIEPHTNRLFRSVLPSINLWKCRLSVCQARGATTARACAHVRLRRQGKPNAVNETMPLTSRRTGGQ